SGKGEVESVRTFRGTWATSGEIAYILRIKLGLSKGDRVVLAFNFGLRFFVVFLGCLRAGVIAVPVYPPNPATMNKSLQKLRLIVENCTPKMILTDSAVNKLRLASKLRAIATGTSGWPDIPYHSPDVPEEATSSSFGGWLGGVGNGNGNGNGFEDPSIQPDDVAFLQFTSGSTSDPKGVMVTFGSLEHNISCLIRSTEAEVPLRDGAERAWFSWLPTYHDMGLIQGTLAPFVAGWTAAFCSPISFMRNPLIWLQLMSKEKSNMSAAPDFAYRLCVRKWNEMTPEAQAALNLDLRHIVRLQNAAEPIRADTVRDFGKAFMPVGLPASYPVAAYGLAEHTAACAMSINNAEGKNLDALPDKALQACGLFAFIHLYKLPYRSGQYKIVDPETFREMPVGETGELWVSSPSVAAGYWGKPDLSRETFEATLTEDEDNRTPFGGKKFLRTGDLCHMDSSGLLYVEGRLKDLIIVAGRNIYPQDIEFKVQDASTLVRPGCIAAFSENELGGDLEASSGRLVVFEVRHTSKKDSDMVSVSEALQAVRRAVLGEFGLDPSRVVAVRERTIPKTTSGKIQRRKTRDTLHDGGLDVVLELLRDSTRSAVSPASGSPVALHLSLATKQTAASPVGGASQVMLTSSNESPISLLSSFRDFHARKATGIEDLDASDDLLDLGVDSLMSVKISSDLSEAFGLDLPPELVLANSTATLIAEYISKRQRDPCGPTNLGRLGLPRSLQLERPRRGVDHGSHARMGVSTDADSSTKTLPGFGLLYALAPTIWFASFTAMVVLAKWGVLGVQPHGRVPLSNYTYLTWWYVNAMLNVWETIGGRWLIGTKLLILFYRMMGAQASSSFVAWSASVKAFIRDFDCVDIRGGATVEGQLYARRFESSHMAVWPIRIGRRAVVGTGSVIYGGSRVGEGCMIEALTVVPPFTNLAPNSAWEGHPAKEVRKGSFHDGGYSASIRPPHTPMRVHQVAKQASIICTLVVLTAMNYVPTILFGSTGLSETFRYAVLVNITFRVMGVVTQLAAFLVMLKWILAGRVSEGTYRPNAFRTWRRWYLGRLHNVVSAYFLVFNRYRRYDWWGAALGMDVGRGSVILMAFNPEDAHLIKVGCNTHLAYPTLSADRVTDGGAGREKRSICIGRNVMVGNGSHFSAGSSVGDGSQLGGCTLLRPGESLASGMRTMCDLESAYQLGGPKSSPPTDTSGKRQIRAAATTQNVIDLSCTLGAWIVNTSAMVASFEVAKLTASLSSYDDGFSTRAVVLWTTGAVAWAIATSLLVGLFQWVIRAKFRQPTAQGVCRWMDQSFRNDLLRGKRTRFMTNCMISLRRGRQEVGRQASSTLTASEVVRWRWMRRVLHFSLFEPLVIDPFLRGTWLLNAWLRLMGADVSMSSLILGRVSDYGVAKVRDGAIVAGVVYGHIVTFADGKWTMEVAPSIVGERAVLHNHARMFCMHLEAGSTLTAASSSLSGQVLPAGKVCGGRPSTKLSDGWAV
ncbi:unnamed protein product, partial [Scytosiphon promiscuus]